MRFSTLFRSVFFCTFILSASNVLAELKPGQARKLLTRVAGSELPSSAVRVKRVTPVDASTAEVRAEIETAFRLEQNQSGQWAIREVRTAPDRWEEMDVIATSIGVARPSRLATGEVTMSALTAPPPVCGCDGPEFSVRNADATEPSVKRARCLLARFLGITLPSDAVRIKEISPLGLPMSSNPSASVVTTMQMDFRFTNEAKKGWRVTQVRTGNRDWMNLDRFVDAINERKGWAAKAELQAVADALERFRRDRGFYVTSDQQRVLIDHLSPRYLAQVIRIDPWHKPYEYLGERDHFTLRSGGPDGKPNTPDDVVLASR
jgi:Type II secretion system (T2SS), protein G